MTFDFMTANGSLGWNPGNAQYNVASQDVSVNAHCACDVCARARARAQSKLTDAEFLSQHVRQLRKGATDWTVLFTSPKISYVSAPTVEEVIAVARARVAAHEAKA